jgi:hypothetical protein
LAQHSCWLAVAELTPKLGSMFLGKRYRMVAAEDCNDDDQSNRVGKGELRVLGAFRNPFECIGSRNGDGGSGSLIGIKFKLDFRCSEEEGGPEAAADKSRYDEEQYWW